MEEHVSSEAGRKVRQIGSTFDSDFTLSLEPYFVPTERFLLPIWEFASRLETIQRYFEYTDAFVRRYLVAAKSHFAKGEQRSAEADIILEDAVSTDERYLKQFHYYGILCQIVAVFEDYLAKMSLELADDLGIEAIPEIDETPHAAAYVDFLINTCKLPCELGEKDLEELNLIRRIRDEYIGFIGSDVPQPIAKAFIHVAGESKNGEFELNYHFIDYAFALVGRLATKISHAYWELHGLND